MKWSQRLNLYQLLWQINSVIDFSPPYFLMDLFNNFNIMSWNIRGASNINARRHVHDLIRMHHPSLFCVYETHVLFSKVERFWLALGYKPVFLQEAQGHSKGIWILSAIDDVTFSLVDTTRQTITFSVKRRDVTWYCTTIYASPIFSIRCHLWDYIRSTRHFVGGPWLFLGDFNEILLTFEVSRGNFSISRASLFANLLTDCGLMDIHSIGGLFTWRKNIQFGGHVRKKLDRCLADVD